MRSLRETAKPKLFKDILVMKKTDCIFEKYKWKYKRFSQLTVLALVTYRLDQWPISTFSSIGKKMNYSVT